MVNNFVFANVSEPFEHEIEFYKDWGNIKKDVIRMSIRKRPKFLKSLVEDIEYNNRYSEKRLSLNQIQAMVVDIGLGKLYYKPYLNPLLEIEKYLLHNTKAGNSSEIIENYEDAIMPYKFANITLGDTNYKISMHESVAGSLGNFARKIRLDPSIVAILCIIHGANEIIENSYEKAYRKRNVDSVKGEVENFDSWVKRQIVRLFVEYDDYEFDLTNGTIKFKYQFNSAQNFTFKGEFTKQFEKSITGDDNV